MSIKVSKFRTIGYNITFLISGWILSVFLPLPWPYFYWVLVASLFYFSLGFFGIYGIIREKWSILCCHGSVLILVVILKVMIIFTLIAAINNSMSSATKFLEFLICRYDQDTWYREQVDYIQKTGHCCGSYGSWNWKWNWMRSMAPESCCESSVKYIDTNGTYTFLCTFYKDGCMPQYEEKFTMTCIVLILVLVIKIILNICAMFDGFYLMKKYRQIANKLIMENPKGL